MFLLQLSVNNSLKRRGSTAEVTLYDDHSEERILVNRTCHLWSKRLEICATNYIKRPILGVEKSATVCLKYRGSVSTIEYEITSVILKNTESSYSLLYRKLNTLNCCQ
jgi:hypothetical protein